MEDYYASLSKNERKNRRKYELRLLKKEYDVQVEVCRDPALAEKEFEAFVAQHTAQWQAERKPGHFVAWPHGKEFNLALVRSQSRAGRLRLIRIIANGQVISYQYAFVFGNTWYWELPSRRIGEQWERFSLGPSGIVTMIDLAIQEGMVKLEGGIGHYDYKVRLGGKELAVSGYRVVRAEGTSRGRVRLFDWIHRGLELVCHKIWYRRIHPLLPVSLRGAQPTAWLRYEF